MSQLRAEGKVNLSHLSSQRLCKFHELVLAIVDFVELTPMITYL